MSLGQHLIILLYRNDDLSVGRLRTMCLSLVENVYIASKRLLIEPYANNSEEYSIVQFERQKHDMDGFHLETANANLNFSPLGLIHPSSNIFV